MVMDVCCCLWSCPEGSSGGGGWGNPVQNDWVAVRMTGSLGGRPNRQEKEKIEKEKTCY